MPSWFVFASVCLALFFPAAVVFPFVVSSFKPCQFGFASSYSCLFPVVLFFLSYILYSCLFPVFFFFCLISCLFLLLSCLFICLLLLQRLELLDGYLSLFDASGADTSGSKVQWQHKKTEPWKVTEEFPAGEDSKGETTGAAHWSGQWAVIGL